MADRIERVQQQVEAQNGSDAGLADVRAAAFTQHDNVNVSAITMDGRIDSLKEFNATFDPKNNVFTAEEIHSMLSENVQQMAATQKLIETRLQSLGITVDKEMADRYLASGGHDVQITGLDKKNT